MIQLTSGNRKNAGTAGSSGSPEKKSMLFEMQRRSLIISVLLIITVQLLSLIVISTMMISEINKNAQTTADELALILKEPLYNIADKQCITIGQSFLASGRISGIILESTATGRLINHPPDGMSVALIPSVERQITYDGFKLGSITLFFSHEELVKTLQRFLIIMLAVIATFTISHTIAEKFVVQKKVAGIFYEVIRNIGEFAAGNYSLRIEETGYSDIDSIIQALNITTERIDEKNKQLVSMNENLEKKVAERTAELRKSLEDSKQMQEKLIENEKLSVLGQLSAGIAHELNTPLGAVISSTGILERFFDGTLLYDTRMVGTFSQKEVALLYLILEHGFDSSKDLVLPRSGIGRRKELKKKLVEANVSEAEKIAYYLSDCTFEENDEEIISWLKNNNDLAVVKTASEMITARRMVQIIRSSSDKAAEVVRALRSYLTSGGQDTPVKVNIDATIQEALTILQNLLKNRVDIHVEYGGVYSLGIADKLCGVWINIITNAVEAMNNKGKIRISTEQLEDHVSVSIYNNGPPVPDEIRGNIFDPFFTTKKNSGGMGLGLDICKRLIASFDGNIKYIYKDGWNQFVVELPRIVD